MKKKSRLHFLLLITGFLLILALLSTGCGRETPAIQTEQPVETVASPAITGPPAETLAPTLAQTSPVETASLAEVILLSPPEADSDLASSLESTLSELASSQGLAFERRASLDSDQLDPATRLVVGLAPDPGLAALAASTPQVQFLAVNLPDIPPGANLSTLVAQDSSASQVGFLAGYLAALVTEEWRVGVLAPGDAPAGPAARQAFAEGVVFFCGLCRQTYPPYVTYPLSAELPSSASPTDWQAAAQSLVDQAVKTVYLAPGADSDELAAYLAKAGVNLIGNRPPPAATGKHWVATLQADPAAAIRENWPSLLAGNEGKALPVPLSVSHVNEAILTPGRMRLLEERIADLEAGFITPVTP